MQTKIKKHGSIKFNTSNIILKYTLNFSMQDIWCVSSTLLNFNSRFWRSRNWKGSWRKLRRRTEKELRISTGTWVNWASITTFPRFPGPSRMVDCLHSILYIEFCMDQVFCLASFWSGQWYDKLDLWTFVYFMCCYLVTWLFFFFLSLS